MDWLRLYEQALAHGESASGYYNDNIRVATLDGPVNVRIPIHGAEVMDLRLWREEHVLPIVGAYVRGVPRLLHTSAAPAFQVHEFIVGEVLNDISPRGAPVPAHVLDDVTRLFVQLTQVPRHLGVPASWPTDDDTPAFAGLLTAFSQQIYDTFRDECASLFAALGIPDDPLAPVSHLCRGLVRRPFSCVHADVHRRNMVVDAGATSFLDWELALWGDPVYDLAVHLHKMGYLPEERGTLTSCWAAAMPSTHTFGWERDLKAYLVHEQIKSAIVDSVRYARRFAQGGLYPCTGDQLANTLTAKINAARRHWRIPQPASPEKVGTALRLHPPDRR